MFEELNIDPNNIAKINNKFFYNTPNIQVRFSTHNSNKDSLSEIEAQQYFLELRNQYQQHQVIYSDGSLQGDKTGCAVIFQDRPHLFRLPNDAPLTGPKSTGPRWKWET